MRGTKRIAIFIATAVLLVLSGCAKYTTDCQLIIRPRVFTMKPNPTWDGDAAHMVRVYTYYISEDDMLNKTWAPASYADADAGIVRHADTGEVLSHGLIGEQDKEDTYVHLTLSRSPVLLVAVVANSSYRFYAWRTLDYQVPLTGPVTIPVRFHLWEKNAQITDTYWTVVNADLQEQQAEEEQEG